MRISPLNCMRMTNLKNLLVQSKLGGSAKKKKGYSPHISLDYNHNTTTTSVLISIFEKKYWLPPLIFVYIYIYFTEVKTENIPTRNLQENQLIQG